MKLLPQPLASFLNGPDLEPSARVLGPSRQVSWNGRSGWQLLSRHSRIQIPEHNINDSTGSLTLWLLALEDLDTVCHQEHIRTHDPHYAAYTILTDNGDQPRAWTDANFALVWSSGWYPQFFAKFFRGNIYPQAYTPIHKALVAAGHWHVARKEWYQLALTWDKPNSEYRLYVNSVCVAVSNRFRQQTAEACGPQLYLGNTALACAELQFFDQALSPQMLEEKFRNESANVTTDIQNELRRTYAGQGIPNFHWIPDASWSLQLNAPLNRVEDLELFQVQGCATAPRITSEGLELVTPPAFSADEAPKWDKGASVTDPITNGPLMSYLISEADRLDEWPNRDRSQVYLWTRQRFEGDLAVEFDFMATQENGLCLVMFHAAGMQREDVLTDDPQRETGSMSTVCWENVRNYHWEFYRQLTDARNDVASHVIVKNPWLRPLYYTCQSHRLSVGEWHRLQFVQVSGRLRGAVDGQLVIDANDSASTGTGAILDCGHLVIRAMLNTRMRFRNIRVFTRGGVDQGR